MKETEDIWRLYHREWIIVHTVTMSAADARPVVEQANQWAKENLTGRIREQDIALVAHTDQKLLFWCHVEVFKDNLKGEFKYVEAAQVYAAGQGWEEYVIVPRNSKSDHEIRSYGVVKL